MRKLSLLVLALPLVALACSSDEIPPADVVEPPAPSTSTEPGVQELGRDVTALRAEATAIAHHLAEGSLPLEAARQSFVGRLEAVDFDGKPSFYLVFSATDSGIADPLAYAKAKGLDLQVPGSGTTTLVGASEEHPEIGLAQPSLALLYQLRTTVDAIGGASQIAALIAPLPGVFLVQTKSGETWDVFTEARIEPEILASRREELDAYLKSSEAAAQRIESREVWAQRHQGEGSAPSLSSFVTRRGNLDVAAAANVSLAGLQSRDIVARAASAFDTEALANNQQGLWSTSTENCTSWWFFGWHSSCDYVEVGELTNPTADQAHYPFQGRGSTVPKCLTGAFGGVDDNAYLGCGPAAFASLVWIDWRKGADYTSLASLDRKAFGVHNKVDNAYRSFSQLVGRAAIPDMGTCSWGDSGSMTMPGGLKSGGNAWLRANGSDKKFQLFQGSLRQKAELLHSRVGLEGKATVVGFDTGFASAHWSPVHKYRLVRSSSSNTMQVYIQSMDVTDRWYSLGGVKLLSALAWLE